MSTTIGSVDFIVGLDGRTTPAQARRIANGIARSVSNGLSSKQLDKQGNAWGARLGDSMVKSFGERWKGLSQNTRQWTLIVGAVISAMQELAVLSAAAGAGLLVLGGAITASAVGLVGLVAAFVPFLGEIDKVPASLRSSRAAFDEFSKSAKNLQTVLSEATFGNTESIWQSLQSTMDELTPSVKILGGSLRDLIGDFAKSVAPGTKGFKNLSGLIEKSGPIFRRVMGIVGRFGDALLTAFNDPRFQKSLEQFLGWLDLLVERFTAFVESPAFDQWLDNADRVFGAFGSLLDTTARMLNDLVTPEAVDRLVDFIGNIERFLGGPGKDVIEFFGELNIFGLIAEGLADIGEALAPIAAPMKDFAEALNIVIGAAIDSFAGVVSTVAQVLGTIATGISDFMKEDPEGAKTFLENLGGAIGALAAALLTFNAIKWAKAVAGLVTVAGLKGLAGKAALISGIALAFGELADILATGDFSNFTTLDGALLGGLLGSPFGAPGVLVGSLIGTLTAIIGDMFDGVHGPVNEGFEQLFDPTNYEGAGIGPFKQWINEEFNVFLVSFWPTIVSRFAMGWNQIVTFFTVNVPQFFEGLGQWFEEGWTNITDWFYENVGSKFETGWIQIQTFFVVGIPLFFAEIFTKFVTGWEQIVAGWNGFWSGLQNGWNVFWLSVRIQVAVGWALIQTAFMIAFLNIRAGWEGFWGGLGAAVGRAVETVKGQVNRIIGVINGLIGKVNTITAPFGAPSIPNIPRLARGGIAWSSMVANIGEAGPEMVVPLRRPLGMIDPAVRDVAAYAQGKRPAEGGAGMVVEQITVVEAGDPARSAQEVIDRLYEQVAS